METAQQKISSFIDFLNPSNDDIYKVSNLVKKHSSLTLSDLAKSLGMDLQLFSRRLYTISTNIKKLGGEKKKEYLSYKLNTSIPSSTVTSDTIDDTNLKEKDYEIAKLIKVVEHEKEKSENLIEVVKQKQKEQDSAKKKKKKK